MKYLFSKKFDTWIDESVQITYRPCHDGIAVTGGSLLGSGFEPYYLNGITVPEEINGIPVTELTGTFREKDVGYIEATKLKRINIAINTNAVRFDFDEPTHSFPVLCGGLQETLESAEFTFNAEKAYIRPIGDGALRRALREVTFAGTVIDDPDWDFGSFQPGLFRNCSRLKSVNGVFEGHTLSSGTFEGCASLVWAPDLKVKQMGSREFLGCASLSRIHLFDGLKGIGSECFKDCEALEDIFVPESTEYFGEGVFDGCIRLKTIHLPKRMNRIPDRIFSGCRSLQKVFLSDGIQTIGQEAFADCAALSRPWLPNGLTAIGERAFAGCVSMGTVFIPETVSSIGRDAFADCGALMIRGKAGGAAEQYAKENGVVFASD